MNVGELRKSLEGVDDKIAVVIYLPHLCKPGVEADYMHHVAGAEFQPKSPISYDTLEIEAGAGFGW